MAAQFLQDLLVVGLSNAVIKTTLAPVDRVKLLIQNQDDHPKIRNGELQKYTGIRNCFYRIIREEGFSSLWRGNNVQVFSSFIPVSALNFALKNLYGTYINTYDYKKQPFKYFTTSFYCGGLTGASALLIVHPFTFARTRLALDIGCEKSRQFKNTLHCFEQIVQTEGFKGLYRGYFASVWGVALFRAIYFSLYDVATIFGFKTQSFALKFSIAIPQAITLFATFNAYPLDTVSRRLMLQTGGKQLYKGTVDCLKQNRKEGGIKSLFKGAGINIVKSFSGAVILLVYDYASNFFKEKKN